MIIHPLLLHRFVGSQHTVDGASLLISYLSHPFLALFLPFFFSFFNTLTIGYTSGNACCHCLGVLVPANGEDVQMVACFLRDAVA